VEPGSSFSPALPHLKEPASTTTKTVVGRKHRAGRSKFESTSEEDADSDIEMLGTREGNGEEEDESMLPYGSDEDDGVLAVIESKPFEKLTAEEKALVRRLR